MSDAVNKPAHYNQGQIECIDAMKIVLTPEEFRGYLKGNVFKYLWREKDKNGNEDLRKGKSYYDLLIKLVDESEQQKAADLQSLKDHPFGKLKETAIKQSLTTEPPDDWRFLEVGEVIRKGDRCFTSHSGSIDCLTTIGEKFNNLGHYPTIRRNRFEVGEKVLDCRGGVVFTVQHFDKEHQIVFVDSVSKGIESKHLAPYIEDAK